MDEKELKELLKLKSKLNFSSEDEPLPVGYKNSIELLQIVLPHLEMVIELQLALFRAIKKRYPTMEDETVEVFMTAIIEEIIKRFKKGEDIAFIKRHEDGSVDLTPFIIEEKQNK